MHDSKIACRSAGPCICICQPIVCNYNTTGYLSASKQFDVFILGTTGAAPRPTATVKTCKSREELLARGHLCLASNSSLGLCKM